MDISREMAKTACRALSEKKAEDLRVIEIMAILLSIYSLKKIVYFTIWKKYGQMAKE